MNSIIFSDALARHLEVSEDAVYELARTRQLPFAITSASPRRLCIEANDLPQWRKAAAENIE